MTPRPVSKRQIAGRLKWPYTTLLHRMEFGTSAANWKAINEARAEMERERRELIERQRRPIYRSNKWRVK